MARNLTDGEDGFLNGTRYLIHDRDPLFTPEFREVLRISGVRAVKLPAQSPDLNAFAERFVRSIREECISRVVPLGERPLRWVIGESVKHYHLEWNHQGLGKELFDPRDESGRGRVTCRERLSGLLRYDYRDAA
jgi:transposase InsO family protein